MTSRVLLRAHLAFLLVTATVGLMIVLNRAETTVSWWAALVFCVLTVVGCIVGWFYARLGLWLLILICLAVQAVACLLSWSKTGSMLDTRIAAITLGNILILLGLTTCLLSLDHGARRD